MVPFSLENKNILVTGASSGIGASCCIICSEFGANLILIGRRQSNLDKTLEKLKKGNHTALSYDLMNIESLEKALGEPLKKYGKIHGFIHSAGIDITRPLSYLRQIDYQALFNINVVSGFEIARIL